jgi:ABC-type Fe3+ transport system substrate-binding protein
VPGGIIYNTQRVPYAPTKLEDLLKPEWKGKIASTPYASGFDLLAASDVWGEERALDFARKLTGQISGLIRCNELDRIASGEFIAFAMDCLGREWLEMRRKGAPLMHVVPADLAAQRFYYMVVPKNSKSPAASKLFATFLHTPEGQKLIWKWTDTDLHTYSDGEMAKEIGQYVQKGIVFKQFVISWYMEHPEALESLRKVVPILTGASK